MLFKRNSLSVGPIFPQAGMKLDKNRLGKVIAVYASAAFIVLQVVDLFQDRLDLPDWLFPAALILLAIGLPIVLTTAIVQDNDFESKLVERHFTWRKAIGGGVAAFVCLAIVAALYARDRFGGGEELDANLVAVFPFRVSGADPSLRYLSEGMVDLLAAKLTGEAGPRAADARTTLAAWRRIDAPDPEPEVLIRAARSVGARRVIVGAIVGNSAQLTINASVTDTRTGRRVEHSVTGRAEELPAKVDELAAILLSLDAGEPRDRLTSLTSTSLPAVRSYLVAEDQYRNAHYTEAVKHYLDALSADSTFALAALGILANAGWTPAMPAGTVNKARTIAWTHRAKLSEVDGIRLVALMGDEYPWPETQVPACVAWDRVIQRAPDRTEAWHYKADCVYHFWKFKGMDRTKAMASARTSFEKSLLLDSAFLPTIQHLVPMAAARHDVPEARRLTRIFLSHDSTSEVARMMKWYLAYAEGRKSELYNVDSMRLSMPTWLLEWGDDYELVDSVLTLSLAELRRRSPSGRSPMYMTISIATMRGRMGDAIATANEADANGGYAGGMAALVSAMYSDWDSTDVVRQLARVEALAAGPRPQDEARAGTWYSAHCVLGQWRLWSGDVKGADRAIAVLNVTGDVRDPSTATRYANRRLCHQIVTAIRATVTKSPDAKQQAIRLDSMSAAFPQYSVHHNYIRLVASRLLEMHGELEAARAAISRTADDMGYPFAYDGELLQRARLSAKLRDREAAIRDYRKYLAFRDHPDATGAKQTEQARRELAALMDE